MFMRAANESLRMAMSREEQYDDKQTFLHNLAWLLGQTREPIKDIVLIKNGTYALVRMERGDDLEVCIDGDSYFAAIKDIVNHYVL